jgi:hypothetical protein
MEYKARKKKWTDVTITVPEQYDTVIQEEYANQIDSSVFNYDNFTRFLRIKGIKFKIK